MAEQERDSSWNLARLVYKMDIESVKIFHLNRCAELGQFIDLDFSFTPIELVFPVCGQSLDIGQWGSVVPSCLVELVRE